MPALLRRGSSPIVRLLSLQPRDFRSSARRAHHPPKARSIPGLVRGQGGSLYQKLLAQWMTSAADTTLEGQSRTVLSDTGRDVFTSWHR